MFTYNIINNHNFTLKTNTLDKIFEKISEKIAILQKGELNIVFVSEKEIKNLNKIYRNIDKVTDVLSFNYFYDFSNCKEDDTVGEIILCESKIQSQGLEFGLGEEKEFYKLVIHSILHILSFDHEEDEDYEKMSKLEKIIWDEI